MSHSTNVLGGEEDDASVFERRREAIQSMPPGPEREQALADLSRDYEGRSSMAEGRVDSAETELADAMDMPGAETAGSSRNPFAVAVAPSALQYAAKGLRGYRANKDRKAARADLEELSEGKERATSSMLDPGILAKKLREKMPFLRRT